MTDLMWRKSSYSAENGECVELAALGDGTVGVRDSKHQDETVLVFSRLQVAAWLNSAKRGEFDHLI